MLNFLRYELANLRASTLGWALAVGMFGCVYVAFYPSLPPEMTQLDLSQIELYRAIGALDMTTFEGYVASTILLFMGIIAVIYGITVGVYALAGEEEEGTLELLVTLPLTRMQVVLVKGVAILLSMLAVLALAGAALAVLFIAIRDQIQTDITPFQIFQVVLNAWPLASAFAMFGLWMGASLPSRKLASGAAVGLLLASFLGNNLAGMVEGLAGTEKYSLFHYYNTTVEVFTEGVAASDVLTLAGALLVFWLLAGLAFQRRNLTAAVWPWQRVGRSKNR